MSGQLITLMQKGMLDQHPKPIKTRAGYIANQMEYGFFRTVPFAPVEGVMLAIENQGKYSNFIYDGELIHGLVVFYRGTEKSVFSLSAEQKLKISQWFLKEHPYGE